MGRPPKLTPEQDKAINARLLAGESLRQIAKDYGISPSTIIRRVGTVAHVSEHAVQVQQTARKLADAQTCLEALPAAHRPVALNLAERLKNISHSLAMAAELGAQTSHRLQALSNSEVAKVDDADPMASIDSLRNVGVLTKLANDSASIALNLLAANKETVVKINTETPKPAGFPVSRLSTDTLREIIAAKNG